MTTFSPPAVHLLTQSLLESIKQALEPGKIEFLVLKGPHLAYTVYDDPLERSWVDVDILVRPDDLARALALLAPCGITPAAFVAGRAATSRVYYNTPLKSPLSIPVELHRELSGYGRYPIDPLELFQTKAGFSMNGLMLFGLGPEYLLLHLCIHMAKSYFQVEYKHLMDIQRLILKKAIQWDFFCLKAKESRCTIAAYYALQAARNILCAEIPPKVIQRLMPPCLRKTWLDRHLCVDGFPIYRHPAHTAAQRRVRMALPLMDRMRDWPLQILGYARLRFKDRFPFARPARNL
jgi:hypothetical protein